MPHEKPLVDPNGVPFVSTFKWSPRDHAPGALHPGVFYCPICSKSYTRTSSVRIHLIKYHNYRRSDSTTASSTPPTGRTRAGAGRDEASTTPHRRDSYNTTTPQSSSRDDDDDDEDSEDDAENAYYSYIDDDSHNHRPFDRDSLPHPQYHHLLPDQQRFHHPIPLRLDSTTPDFAEPNPQMFYSTPPPPILPVFEPPLILEPRQIHPPLQSHPHHNPISTTMRGAHARPRRIEDHIRLALQAGPGSSIPTLPPPHHSLDYGEHEVVEWGHGYEYEHRRRTFSSS
ncbi:hypothetical protein BJ742DRAFT_737145 [Cladochytrium replicatum]|nr:hypothetical protein BJ742DRAFT_737145 [Cladochytrium replicatum]